jgi:hypothetical protein
MFGQRVWPTYHESLAKTIYHQSPDYTLSGLARQLLPGIKKSK